MRGAICFKEIALNARLDLFILLHCEFLLFINCDRFLLLLFLFTESHDIYPTSLSKEIASSVIYANMIKEIWEDLKERFAQRNGPRIFEIQKSISILSQDSSSVSSYDTSLKSFWDELSDFKSIPDCSCGAMKVLLDNKQHEYVMQFLMGLNDSFSHVRA